MAGKRNLKQKMASIFELPGDVLLDVARISVVGDREMLVESHRSITEYTPERIVLGLPTGHVTILGDNLQIGSISPDGVIILGKIREIRYLD